MWLLEIEPGSFAGATILLSTDMPIHLPKLSEVNCIYSCTTIHIIIDLRQKFEAVYLKVYVSLILHWLIQKMKKKQGLSKIAEHEGISLDSITSEVRNYL